MIKKTILFVWLVSALLFVQGCGGIKIAYKMNDIPVKRVEDLSRLVLDVQIFEDVRQSVDDNQVLFTSGKQARIGATTYCINSEKHYDQGTVPTQISKLIAEHLKKKKTFKEVTFNKREEADIYLVGKLKRFYGQRVYSLAVTTTLQTGMMFGAIGGALSSLATLTKMPGYVEIEFSDLVIYRKDGSVAGKVDDIHDRAEKKINADGYCWSIYRAVNEELKNAVEKLAAEIETTLLPPKS
jgi:hypothetical protein